MILDEKKEDALTAHGATSAAAAASSTPPSSLLAMSQRGNRLLLERFSSKPIDGRLTDAERAYLENLQRRGDPNLVERATQRLSDPVLFPPLLCENSIRLPSGGGGGGGGINVDVDVDGNFDDGDNAVGAVQKAAPDAAVAATTTTTITSSIHIVANNNDKKDNNNNPNSNVLPPPTTTTNTATAAPPRRNSHVQQELFRLHETQAVPPSHLLKKMNFVHQNSLLEDTSAHPAGGGDNDDDDDDDDSAPFLVETHPEDAASPTTTSHVLMDEWNPFLDISSWIDGSQGVEVGDNGVPITTPTSHSHDDDDPDGGDDDDHEDNDGDDDIRVHHKSWQHPDPFLILGTAADDVTCHPHVLSPPLMESLLAFVPEHHYYQSSHHHHHDAASAASSSSGGAPATSNSNHNHNSNHHNHSNNNNNHNNNFFLKYSLVRDGASLATLLRQVRASEITILAIETTDGHVLGSCTSHAWRLAQGWYGGTAAFLWKMRQRRGGVMARSILEQINQEREIQVFPYRPGHRAVQYCSADQLMLGQGELLPHDQLTGEHYGHGLYLESNLLRGSTSTSETFGNPCLVQPHERGARFEVSNLEVWTLTPHRTVEEAEQSELSHLFLVDRDDKDLNLMRVLVGGSI